jgi:hypothetical protein
VLRDNIILATFSSNVFCLTLIISTFQLQLADKPIIATSLVTFHVLAFVSLCFHGGCLAIVRIACMLNMNFMEETLGENFIRNFLIGISLTAAIGTSYFQIVNDDMNNGPVHFLITRQTVSSGM